MVHDLSVLNVHSRGLQKNPVIMRDHMIERVFDPLPLTGSLVGLVGGQSGLGVGPPGDKVWHRSRPIRGNGMTEVFAMHRSGEGGGPVTMSAKPCQTLFEGNPLGNGERPVDRV